MSFLDWNIFSLQGVENLKTNLLLGLIPKLVKLKIFFTIIIACSIENIKVALDQNSKTVRTP